VQIDNRRIAKARARCADSASPARSTSACLPRRAGQVRARRGAMDRPA